MRRRSSDRTASETEALTYASPHLALLLTSNASLASRGKCLRGHTRHLTDLGVIVAKKIARNFNVADAGTHYCTKDVLHEFDKKLRNA